MSTRRLLAPATLATVSVAGAVLITLTVIWVFGSVQFPAFTSSNVLRALTVVAQTAALIIVAVGAWLARRGECGQRIGPLSPSLLVRLGKLLMPAAQAGLVAASLGIPLSATRLYLMGVSVDQEFRMEFLSRSATTWGLPDMTYQGLPSFYPSGWFWLGGRFAGLLGVNGWEAFKPWAIASLAATAALATVLWTRLLRTDLGAAIAVMTTLGMLLYGSPEPYGAVVALLAPPMLLLAWQALSPRDGSDGQARTGNRGAGGFGGAFRSATARPGLLATVAVTLYLGFSACCYTLYTAWFALTIVLMALGSALIAWLRTRTARSAPATPPAPTTDNRRAALVHATGIGTNYGLTLPIVRLLLMGIGSALLALLVWAPYLWASLWQDRAKDGAAAHYLPRAGAGFPLPMLETSVVGAVCLIGLVWLALRFGRSRRATALGCGVLSAYAWSLLSMAVAAFGTTLLSFRLELPLVLLFCAAAMCGTFDLVQWGRSQVREGLPSSLRSRMPVLAAVLTTVFALGLAQQVPEQLSGELRLAYEDVDGHGERGDRKPARKRGYYPEIDAWIREASPHPATDTVVAATADGFLSYYPYLGFQAVTSHYANPLGQYSARHRAMLSWAEARSPETLHHAVTSGPWRGPDFILAERTSRGYALELAEDVFPNDPNIRAVNVVIPRSAVAEPLFRVHEIGPYAVIQVQ